MRTRVRTGRAAWSSELITRAADGAVEVVLDLRFASVGSRYPRDLDHDLHRFVVATHPLGNWDDPPPGMGDCAGDRSLLGDTDEQAWKDLPGAPRDPTAELWQPP